MSDLEAIRDAARAFREERDWEKFQDPKSVMLALVGEVGELAELMQWLPADEARDRLTEEPLRTRVADELSDVLIYLVTLADKLDVDLGSAALAKIEKSAAKHPVPAVRGIAPNMAPVKPHPWSPAATSGKLTEWRAFGWGDRRGTAFGCHVVAGACGPTMAPIR